MKKVYIETMMPDNYEELIATKEGFDMSQAQVLNFLEPEDLVGALVSELFSEIIQKRQETFDYTLDAKTKCQTAEYVIDHINENKMLHEPLDDICNVITQLIEEFEEDKDKKESEDK